MSAGKELLREKPSPADRGAGLVLNPRWPAALRERVLAATFPDLERHLWLATSGTGGALKLVALSWAALEASAQAVNRHLAATADDVWLNALPLFHVGGVGMMVRARCSGARHVTFDCPWNAADFTAAAASAGATLSAVVPAQVHDLVRAGCSAPRTLRSVVVGGGALDESLRARAVGLGWPLLPSYGLTEAGSQVATVFPGSPDGVWLPLLDHVQARVAADGLLELHGPSLLTGWMIFDESGARRWEDPKVDGWFRTGDRAGLRGRAVRILGRADDLVKIRGELVDVPALERAVQARVGAGGVAVFAVADERNGCGLRVVTENAAAADEVRRAQDDIFPPYARPREIVVGSIRRTALGKTVRP